MRKVLRKLAVYLLCTAVAVLTASCSSMSPKRQQACLIGAGVGASRPAASWLQQSRGGMDIRDLRIGCPARGLWWCDRWRNRRMLVGEGRAAADPATSAAAATSSAATASSAAGEDHPAWRPL